MRFKNLTPYLFGYRPSARRPPHIEMTAIVRGKYKIVPGKPLVAYRAEQVAAESLETLAAETPEAAKQLEEALVLLGQGALSAERYHDGDDNRRGELLYPGDFAELKLCADIMVRGSCHVGRKVEQCTVEVTVGDWRKELRVTGHRVFTDVIARSDTTAPSSFSSMPIDYAHAYGGPGFSNNPVGKAHLEPSESADEDIYQPPRSARSLVMPGSQLANIQYADGSNTKSGFAAGFGPLSPQWAYRAAMIGKDYGAEWRKTRAPFCSSDFDWRHQSAAPPDQQLKGFLRGDEPISFRNMHPRVRRLALNLPGERIRVWVLDVNSDVREITMNLDTLYAELDDDALYLTWRGLTTAQEDDLADIEYALIASEPLAERRLPGAPYVEQLRAFARDPAGLEDALPAEVRQAAAAAELAEDGKLFEASGEDNPVSAALSHLGTVAQSTLNATRTGMGIAFGALDPASLKRALANASRHIGMPAGPNAATGALLKFADQLDDAEARVGPDPKLDDAREKIAAAIPEQSGAGLSLAGADLSHQDLAGLDLTGADLSGALLDHADLSGADLSGADLSGCQCAETNFNGANLHGANLSMATFNRATAVGTKFTEAIFNMTHLNEVDARGAELARARGQMPSFITCKFDDSKGAGLSFEQASFDEVSLQRAEWDGAELKQARFRQCRALDMGLRAAQLDGASFRGCDLSRARLSKARGVETAFIECDLADADFEKTWLPSALFQQVRAAGASYRQGMLRHAQFDRSKLTRAMFQDANLRGAGFRKTGLERADFAGSVLFEAMFNNSFGRDCNLDGADLTRTVFEGSELSKR